MAASYSQSAATSAGTTAATIAVAYAAPLTRGTLLLACVFYNSGTETCTVADGDNGAWTAIGGPQIGTAGFNTWSAQMFKLVANASTGTPTVTATCSGTNPFRGLAIHEYFAGDVESSGYLNNNAIGHVSPSLTPASDGAGAWMWCIPSNSILSVAAPYTMRQLAAFASSATADNVSLTNGVATSATFTANAAAEAINGGVIMTQPPATGPFFVPHRMPLGV